MNDESMKILAPFIATARGEVSNRTPKILGVLAEQRVKSRTLREAFVAAAMTLRDEEKLIFGLPSKKGDAIIPWMVEDGHAEYNLRDRLLKNGKSKPDKNGVVHNYVNVPFEIDAAALNKAARGQSKSRPAVIRQIKSIIAKTTRHSYDPAGSGTIIKQFGPLQKGHYNRFPGGVVSKLNNQNFPDGTPRHAVDPLQDMLIYEAPHSAKGGNTIRQLGGRRTFRRLSVNSPAGKWKMPARPAADVFVEYAKCPEYRKLKADVLDVLRQGFIAVFKDMKDRGEL